MRDYHGDTITPLGQRIQTPPFYAIAEVEVGDSGRCTSRPAANISPPLQSGPSCSNDVPSFSAYLLTHVLPVLPLLLLCC